MSSRVPRTVTDWCVFGGIFGVVILLMIVVAIYHKRRRAKLARAAHELGLGQVDARSPDAGFVHRPQPRESRFCLEVCAVGLIDGRAARMAEYHYAMPSGKSHITHHNLQLSLECPDAWPRVRIGEVRGIATRAAAELLWVDPAGAPAPPWTAERAEELLNQQARALLALGAGFESWDVGDGWLTCTWKKSCTADLLPALIERTRTVLQAMSTGWTAT